jgi:ankyrin repeat protein
MGLRSGPLRHTAIFVVVKEREDRQGRKIIEMMVRKGADLNARNAMGQTPLFYAVAHDKPETCRYLIQQKVDVDI